MVMLMVEIVLNYLHFKHVLMTGFNVNILEY